MHLVRASIAAPKSRIGIGERRLHAVECVTADVVSSHRNIPFTGRVESSQRPDLFRSAELVGVSFMLVGAAC
jgi:hypothetical protein